MGGSPRPKGESKLLGRAGLGRSQPGGTLGSDQLKKAWVLSYCTTNTNFGCPAEDRGQPEEPEQPDEYDSSPSMTYLSLTSPYLHPDVILERSQKTNKSERLNLYFPLGSKHSLKGPFKLLCCTKVQIRLDMGVIRSSF